MIDIRAHATRLASCAALLVAEALVGKTSMKCVRGAAGLILLTVAWSVPATSLRAAELETRVLILNAADPYLPGYLVVDAAMREALAKDTTRRYVYFSETLDGLRFDWIQYEPELFALLAKKYKGQSIDVVVAVTRPALDFVNKHGNQLWPDARVVFHGIPARALESAALPGRVTGVVTREDNGDGGTLDLARRLQPDARRILVIAGVADYDQYEAEQARKVLATRAEPAQVEFLLGLPKPELVDRIKQEATNTIVLYLSEARGHDGRPYTPREVLRAISAASPAPVYGLSETYVGLGAVGGVVESYGDRGRLVAERVRQVVAGMSPVPALADVPYRCVTDARALRRWSLDDGKLPEGCDIRFDQRPFWREYPLRTFGALAVVLIQGAMISALLFERRGRKRAEVEAQRAFSFERLLADISASLLREPLHNADREIRNALRAIGEFLGLERIVLWKLGMGDAGFEQTHAWIADGTTAAPVAKLPSITRRVARGEIVNLASIEELPAGADADKQVLREFGIRSLLIVPLAVEAVIVGAVSLTAIRAPRVWPEALVPRVRLIGEAFASMLARRRASEEVGEARVETGQYRERLAHLVRAHTAGEMSAAIAHEINQPLVAIKNYALAARRRLATRSTVDVAKVEGLMDKIEAQASRAGDILQSLRAMVKRHQFEMTKIDVGQVVTEGLKLAELESNLLNVQIEVAVTPDLPMVLADEVQIQQVVLNLARNAIEATEEVGIAGVIHVGVMGIAEKEVVVSVADCGSGIAPDELERIFEPFYSTKGLGLGIGLSISRAIVEAHGGHLTVVSNAGGGSVFRFTLPAANDGD